MAFVAGSILTSIPEDASPVSTDTHGTPSISVGLNPKPPRSSVAAIAFEVGSTRAMRGVAEQPVSHVASAPTTIPPHGAGNPKFWQRGRILVLYLGNDPAVEGDINTVLGQPFARGQGLAPGPDLSAC